MMITIKPVDHGKRIDRFLQNEFPKIAKVEIRKNLRKGNITVNKQKVHYNFLLQKDDLINIDEKCFTQPAKIKKAKKKLIPKIIFENDDYLVLEKPAGLVVHPTTESETGTMRDWLLEKYPTIISVGENKLRPGIMHRLDKDVSGLMVIAKNQNTYEHLKQQFATGTTQKQYLALLLGKLPKQEGIIDLPIARSARGHRMAARSKQQAGKTAITEYTVVEYFGRTQGENHGYTLAEIKIKTGRTHQIRAHMHALGHPVVGDNLYRLKKQKKVHELGRIFLHAQKLGFYNLKNELVEYQSDLPEILQKFLTNI